MNRIVKAVRNHLKAYIELDDMEKDHAKNGEFTWAAESVASRTKKTKDECMPSVMQYCRDLNDPDSSDYDKHNKER
jgi:hypothetical protein